MLTAIETRISARASDTLRAALLLATCGAAAWLASHASFATDLLLAPFVFAGLLSLTLWQGLYKLVATLNAGVRQAYCVALTLGSAGWLVVSAYLHSTGHDRLSGNSLKLSFALAASALLFSILRFEVSLM